MRIVLADDAALLREGLAGLLQAAGHDVVAQVADADSLRSCVDDLAQGMGLPDVVVTDVRMPPTGSDDGLRAAIDLRRRYPGLPVVVLSAYVAGPYLHDLLDGAGSQGAVGYLLKERVGRVSDFLQSLGVVQAGGVVVDPDVLATLMKSTPESHTGELDTGMGLAESDTSTQAASGVASEQGEQDWTGTAAERQANRRRLARLTPRESEVLALMAQGLSNGQIAQQLVLSDGAIAKHVANIFTKLDLPPSQENRRVRAVLSWLRDRAA